MGYEWHVAGYDVVTSNMAVRQTQTMPCGAVQPNMTKFDHHESLLHSLT